jgi:hypothetical protein
VSLTRFLSDIFTQDTIGGAPKAKAVNKKTILYFKSLIERMKAEKLELDRVRHTRIKRLSTSRALPRVLHCLRFFRLQLNMDLTMELLDSSDSAVSVTVNSVVGGSGKAAVHIILFWVRLIELLPIPHLLQQSY